jgi:hypothetical protein
LSVATGMMAFEDHQRAEITPSQTAEPATAETTASPCAAAVEHQKYLIRRMTLMAFGIPQSTRHDEERLARAAASCDDQ